MSMMFCRGCQQTKAETEFYIALRRCKECVKAQRRQPENLAKIQARDRARGQLPQHKEAVKARADRYSDKPYRQASAMRAKNPTAAAARTALSNAVRDGRIIRPDRCEACGEACKPHGHHDDYARPFDVLWLCSGCHGAVHRDLNERERVA
jgi:hypothetical protein